MGTWHHNDLTIATGSSPSANKVSGYMFNAQGTQHVLYSGGGLIHEMWWDPSGWHHTDLTKATGSVIPVAGTPVGCGFDARGTQHVIFFEPIGGEESGRVHELRWTPATGWRYGGSLSPKAAQWNGKPAVYVFYTVHVFFWGTDNHIHEYSWNDQTNLWQHADISWGSPPRPAGSPAGYGSKATGIYDVYYCGVDQHIHELFHSPGGWNHVDLTLKSGSPDAKSGTPAAWLFEAQSTYHVAYRGIDDHIYELWADSLGYYHVDLTRATGSPNAAGDPAGYIFEPLGTQHVVYRGYDKHIHELWWDPSGWHYVDLTNATGSPGAEVNPAGYSFAAQGTKHIVYSGPDQHVHELWWG